MQDQEPFSYRRGKDCRKCGTELTEENTYRNKLGICKSCDNLQRYNRRAAEKNVHCATITGLPISSSGYNATGTIIPSVPDAIEKRRPTKTVLHTSKKLTKSASSSLFLDPDQMRVACFDIETSSLKSDFGVAVCAVVKTYGTRDKPLSFFVDLDEPDLLKAERNMLIKLNKTLNEYDGVITYFGNRFDIPFIRTRSLYHGITPLKKTKSLDLYFTVKRVTNPSSRRLDRINQILKISDPDASPDKTRLGLAEWNGVVFSRNKEALKYIVTHCIADVEILENAVNAFIEFVPDRIMRV